MKNTLIISILLIIPLLSTLSCSKGSNDAVITFNSNNFEKEIASGVVLVDFWAEWCMPCKAMTPVIDELASQLKGKVKVGKVDIDSEKSLAKQFNIQAIPTLIILKDGVLVETQTGITSKEAIVSLLEKYVSIQ